MPEDLPEGRQESPGARIPGSKVLGSFLRNEYLKVSEDKKNYDKLQELVEKLMAKLKHQKKQLDEAV